MKPGIFALFDHFHTGLSLKRFPISFIITTEENLIGMKREKSAVSVKSFLTFNEVNPPDRRPHLSQYDDKKPKYNYSCSNQN